MPQATTVKLISPMATLFRDPKLTQIQPIPVFVLLVSSIDVQRLTQSLLMSELIPRYVHIAGNLISTNTYINYLYSDIVPPFDTYRFNIFSLFFYFSSNRELSVRYTDTSFQVLIEQGNLYGPANGIYVANGVETSRTLAKNWCIAGSSYYGTSFQANPSKQPLITFDCRVLEPFG